MTLDGRVRRESCIGSGSAEQVGEADLGGRRGTCGREAEEADGVVGLIVAAFTEEDEEAVPLVGEQALEPGPRGVIGLVTDGEDEAAGNGTTVNLENVEKAAQLGACCGGGRAWSHRSTEGWP